MAIDDDFLHAIIASPEDRACRLVYADWLEERGDRSAEFIRVQCARADSAKDSELWAILGARESSLFEENAHRWLRPVWEDFVNATSFDPHGFRAFAAHHRALPIHCDMGGVLAIDMNGRFLAAGYECLEQTAPGAHPYPEWAAMVCMAKVFPKLRVLLTPRPSSAQTCQKCGGSGVDMSLADDVEKWRHLYPGPIGELYPGPNLFCPVSMIPLGESCGGIGWLP